MKYLPLLLLFLFSSCCKKYIEGNKVDTVFTLKTDTVYQFVPFVTEPQTSKVIDIDLSKLCDSLYSKQLNPQVRTSEPKRNDGTRQLIARTEIDSMLHLIVSCQEDRYRDTLDSVRTLNRILQYEITKTKTVIQEQPVYKNIFFWILIGVIALLVVVKFK